MLQIQFIGKTWYLKVSVFKISIKYQSFFLNKKNNTPQCLVGWLWPMTREWSGEIIRDFCKLTPHCQCKYIITINWRPSDPRIRLPANNAGSFEAFVFVTDVKRLLSRRYQNRTWQFVWGSKTLRRIKKTQLVKFGFY